MARLDKGARWLFPPGSDVRADLPTAFVCLVCRPQDMKKGLVIERSIAGQTVVDLSPIELPTQQERCIQIRDLIPENTLGSGSFSYSVRVKGSRIRRDREFSVSAPTESPR